jgi:hypothetical protein
LSKEFNTISVRRLNHVTLEHVYFPIAAIVSLLYVMENGASAEIAVVGNEGLIGVSLFMGGESTPSRADGVAE